MTVVREISKSLVRARSHIDGNPIQKLELTPWDIRLLPLKNSQRGLLFHRPKAEDTYIQHLKHSLSSTLDFFFPLSGRLSFVQHDNNTISVAISCNNEGALFVHATADNIALSDILDPVYVPHIVHSFFAMNGSMSYEGTSIARPLLAIQITELVDGVFIGCTMNHCVADGTSFWHFFNSWAEISRGLNRVSKLPYFERWFPKGTQLPIRFPFVKEKENCDGLIPQSLAVRIFHFTRENIDLLKAKVNAEVGFTNKISSLQAVLSHVWRSVIRNQCVDPKEEVYFSLVIGTRLRIILHLPEGYFGNALQAGQMTMKAWELLEKGLGYAALEINKMVSLHTEEKLKDFYESWIKSPKFFRPSEIKGIMLGAGDCPRFDIYGNDFGWGKPVAVRSGPESKANGKLSIYAGAERGCIDIELCLPFQILEAMANDPDFMAFASIRWVSSRL